MIIFLFFNVKLISENVSLLWKFNLLLKFSQGLIHLFWLIFLIIGSFYLILSNFGLNFIHLLLHRVGKRCYCIFQQVYFWWRQLIWNGFINWVISFLWFHIDIWNFTLREQVLPLGNSIGDMRLVSVWVICILVYYFWRFEITTRFGFHKWLRIAIYGHS